MTPPCFSCGRHLDPAMDPDGPNQPSGGLAFRSYGHYGTTFFDPVARNVHPDRPRDERDAWVEVNLCDACLREALDTGDRLHFSDPEAEEHAG